jgi:hypothetical protein
MLGQMIRLKVRVFCSLFEREGVLLFERTGVYVCSLFVRQLCSLFARAGVRVCSLFVRQLCSLFDATLL